MRITMQDLAASYCAIHSKWGIYCSWECSEHFDTNRIQHIKKCLPPNVFEDGSHFYVDGWFVKLFDSELDARRFYVQCLGDDSGIHDGVYACLIDSRGNVRTENT